MKPKETQTLIDEIVRLSKECNHELYEKITLLLEMQVTPSEERERFLEQRLVEEINQRRARDKFIQNQAKMAAMGEMMDAVAHQWKQPLNALSLYGDLLMMDFKAGEVTQDYIDKFVDDIQEQITHMVSTLSEFRTFFRPDKEPEPFGLKRCIQSVLLLVHDEMLRNTIDVSVDSKREIIVYGIENEFKHLLLNLLSNAKDALVANDVSERRISIRFFTEGDHVAVEVEDSAGGVASEIIDDIFKPNFTTKGEEKGTGIGLYMSTQIAQKMHGTLTVENAGDGALFRLTIPRP